MYNALKKHIFLADSKGNGKRKVEESGKKDAMKQSPSELDVPYWGHSANIESIW